MFARLFLIKVFEYSCVLMLTCVRKLPNRSYVGMMMLDAKHHKIPFRTA